MQKSSGSRNGNRYTFNCHRKWVLSMTFRTQRQPAYEYLYQMIHYYHLTWLVKSLQNYNITAGCPEQKGAFFMPSNKKEVQRRADEKRKGQRARAWTCVVYPESAPENWQDILRDQLVECLISPLHDKDVEPTGEIKKPHYHVVLSFKNPTSFEKAKEVFAEINGVVPPARECKVKDFKQMARYLCHLDQPNKHRYSVDDVVSIGAIDYPSLVMSGADEDEILDMIFDFIRDNHVVSFAAFIDLVRHQKPEWRRVVYHQYNGLISKYIKSQQWEKTNGIS